MAKINVAILQVGIMLLLFVWVSMAQQISGKIDLVIIAPSNEWSYRMDRFKESIQELDQHIDIGESKTRVAVVEPVHGNCTGPALYGPGCSVPGARILFKMSGNKDELKKWAKDWVATVWKDYYYHHSEAFKLADMIFFNKTNDKTRAKMIIQVLTGYPFGGDRP